jgi:SOS-response transcriptional repressor LexA
MKGLTERETAYVEFIRIFWEQNGYAPSQNEVAANFAVIKETARAAINSCITKGALKMEFGKPRTLRLT